MRGNGRLLALPFVLAIAFAATGCGGGSGGKPVRIGVVADCRGLLGSLDDAMLSGAELPFIRRGARLRGVSPSQGIENASVAGRKVDLLTGCSEVGEFAVLVEEARRLIELGHADVIIGGLSLGSGEGIVLRDLARRYPNVAFVIVGSPRREVTLVRPAANVFRFQPDYAQSVAGLGSYAFERLGWRRATIVADDADAGWEEAAAFASEFCALGGKVVEHEWVSAFNPQSRRLPSIRADGVAAFVSSFTSPPPFVKALARHLGDPARRLILGPAITQEPVYSAAVGPALVGATTSTSIPPPFRTSSGRRLERAYRRAFPALPQEFADGALMLPYYAGVEAVVLGLDAVRGDIGSNGERLRQALARVRLDVPGGRIVLDGHRQAVAPTMLLRVVDGRDANGVAFHRIRVAGPVDQSIGGTLRAREVGPGNAACRRSRPAPWANG
jgi:branched-chain amino acid transport system substrate-binding protein